MSSGSSDVSCIFFFFQAEDGIRDLGRSRGRGDVYKRQIEMLPIVRPRVAAGTRVMTVVNSSGNIIAVPLACTTRAKTSSVKPGAMAARSVPALNSTMAAM